MSKKTRQLPGKYKKKYQKHCSMSCKMLMSEVKGSELLMTGLKRTKTCFLSNSKTILIFHILPNNKTYFSSCIYKCVWGDEVVLFVVYNSYEVWKVYWFNI